MMLPKNPCGICRKNVLNHHKSVFCHNCNLWIHIKCNDIYAAEYNVLQNEPDDELNEHFGPFVNDISKF